MSAPDKLTNDEVMQDAPTGWVRVAEWYEDTHGYPYLDTGSGIYIPAKREPRVWEGTICGLDTLTCSPLSQWDLDTRVRVTEILEEETQ